MARSFAKLDRNAIRALQVGQKISEHGITAERLRDGDTRYSINIMSDGQRVHRVIGRATEGVTREQAERAIESLRTKAREDRLDLPTGRKLHRTFAEASREYLERMEQSGGKDLTNKTRHLDAYLVPHFGTTRLDKITTFDLQRYRKRRLADGAKDATVNREMSTMQHLLNRAASKEWRWIKTDEVPEIPKAKEQRKKIRILTDDQRHDLIEAAKADHDPLAWLFVMFGLNTAMRHSEIVERRYDEIDFEQCRIWINKAKAGERQQPITVALRDALQARQDMIDAPEWIFPAIRDKTKHPHRRDMREAFIRSAVRAGLDPKFCTPHVMRHTGITALVKQGIDVPTIQKISGHKTPAMVLHYVHVFGQHIDDAIGGLNIVTRGAVTPELHTGGNVVVPLGAPTRQKKAG
ncbi:tyrosine-type recombinase/integrase [Sphingomonas sp. PAMC 26617]|uniref:tyrosine-type recombinase/integrase n=1 Tax=Sphingomonas sp. PAMC 26617 TaxID=1112216 RepID=UPI000287DEAB|nr:site-specific integrase [Sphingomonas sp. PAMC 26617]